VVAETPDRPRLRIFYINLDRRADRRAYMEAQFDALGLSAERLRATTPDEIVAADLVPLTLADARRRLAPTEIATSVSHQRAWRRMIDCGETHALVLEDDCELSPRLPAFVAEFDRQGGFDGVVRIETRLRGHILARRAARNVLGIGLHHPFTWEWGAAAYVISADEARRILASEQRFELPVDDMLLSPVSRLRDPRRILQTVPALAFVPENGRELGNQPAAVRVSDMETERRSRFQEERPKAPVRRFAREVRRIRSQIVNLPAVLHHRIFGRDIAVPFAREPWPSERSSAAPPPA
jgi:glycosyl transferase family 25